jgi:hypothetical protein
MAFNLPKTTLSVPARSFPRRLPGFEIREKIASWQDIPLNYIQI